MKAVKSSAMMMVLMLGLMMTLGVYAGDDARTKHYNLDSDDVALKGYDPVSYFVQKKALKGQKRIDLEYKGVTYYFANQENLEKFKANPAKYEPAYGGWCAYALVNGEKVGVDPKHFKIVDGRVFLFYKGWGGDALKLWNKKDEQEQTKKADAEWKKISGEDAPKK